MKGRGIDRIISAAVLITFLGSSILSAGTSQILRSIPSIGSIVYGLKVDVAVDANKTMGVNNLSVGFQISYGSGHFISSSQIRQMAKDANFKIVRFNDALQSTWIPSMMPCTSFDEGTKTGIYNWTNVDDVVAKIFEIGAEPLITIGAIAGRGNPPKVPLGMTINSTTGLPNPDSYASYSAEWVEHFKNKGWNARFYEIINEPWIYFGWEPVDYTKLAYYMKLFKASVTKMRQENPGISVSFDFIGRKPVMDYWLANGGADVDSMNFHKYDAYSIGQHPDTEMLAKAESEYFGTWPLGYSVTDARNVWFTKRGKMLPIINSESNFNSACGSDGTDPKIQQMVGAVWEALLLRMCALNGISYNVYFELVSGSPTPSGGVGFGMINGFTKTPYYPYYVNYFFGNNLAVGDVMKESVSTSNDIRTLAWVHNQTLNVLLVNQANGTRTIYMHGLTGHANVLKIDQTYPWQNATLLSSMIKSDESFVIEGYTVMLLQVSV